MHFKRAPPGMSDSFEVDHLRRGHNRPLDEDSDSSQNYASSATLAQLAGVLGVTELPGSLSFTDP